MKRFEKRVWLASPTMHGEELRYMQEAYETNWMSTVGKNIDEVERLVAEKVGVKYAVALSAGTAALHLGTRLAGVRLFGVPRAGEGALRGQKVFCSDMTFAATLNPVAYENGEAVFIDSERDTWNMDPVALEKAFKIYPDVRLVVLVHLYGTPAKVDEIREICARHNALRSKMPPKVSVQATRACRPEVLATLTPSASTGTRLLPAVAAVCTLPTARKMRTVCASGARRAVNPRRGTSTRKSGTTTA